MSTQKPIKPFKIDPKYFLGMIESFIEAYPQFSWEIKTLAEKGQDELEKLNYSDTKGLGFKDKKVNYANYKPFWKQYLEIEDIEASEYLIKNAVFHKMQPSNHNAIFKTAGKQNLSYSLVVSKVGIKIELLIKSLRKDLNSKEKQNFNKIIFDEIKKNKNELDKKIKNLTWERLDDKIYSRVYFVISKSSLNNKVNLPRLDIHDLSGKGRLSIFSKMAESSDKFYRAFDHIIKKIDIKKMEKKL